MLSHWVPERKRRRQLVISTTMATTDGNFPRARSNKPDHFLRTFSPFICEPYKPVSISQLTYFIRNQPSCLSHREHQPCELCWSNVQLSRARMIMVQRVSKRTILHFLNIRVTTSLLILSKLVKIELIRTFPPTTFKSRLAGFPCKSAFRQTICHSIEKSPRELHSKTRFF